VDVTATDPKTLPPDDTDAADLAEQVADVVRRRGWTAAAAESLTGGQVAGRLAAAPDSGDWFRGGVVAYASQVKHEVLGVPDGPVISGECARAMATGVRDLLGADTSVATTGVGGPDDQEGQPPGTVWFGVAGPDGQVRTELWHVPGDPAQVVERSTRRALRLLLDVASDGEGSGVGA
jgi:nicotinamide-nucleotide amidase